MRVVGGGVAASAVVTGGAVALSASDGSELFVGASLTASRFLPFEWSK
jgi:hypothetical protein